MGVDGSIESDATSYQDYLKSLRSLLFEPDTFPEPSPHYCMAAGCVSNMPE
jgi:hypothetical protein